jgi:hypothetical protein
MRSRTTGCVRGGGNMVESNPRCGVVRSCSDAYTAAGSGAHRLYRGHCPRREGAAGFNRHAQSCAGGDTDPTPLEYCCSHYCCCLSKQ